MNLKQFGYMVVFVLTVLSLVSAHSLAERKFRPLHSREKNDQLLSNEKRATNSVMVEPLTYKAEIHNRMERERNKQAQLIERADGRKVVTMCNSAQLPLLKIWLHRADKLELDVVVIALDEGVANYCRQNNYRYVFDAEFVTSAEDMHFKSPAFLQMGRIKFLWFRRLLLQGHEFAFIEIDIVMVRNPFDCALGPASCFRSDRKYDIESQMNVNPGLETNRYVGKELNIGLMLMRPTVALIAAVNVTISRLEQGGDNVWDQRVFSDSIWEGCARYSSIETFDFKGSESEREVNKGTISLRVLSVFYFPTGGVPPQYGIVPQHEYLKRNVVPTMVHCTGRTGLTNKHDCVQHVASQYYNIRSCEESQGRKESI